MLAHFSSGACPTFKEIATLIGMTIQFVAKLDQILIQELQQYEFLETVLYHSIKEKENETRIFDHANTTQEKRQKKLKQHFITEGITEDFYNDEGERFLAEISELSEAEFKKQVDCHRKAKVETAEE